MKTSPTLTTSAHNCARQDNFATTGITRAMRDARRRAAARRHCARGFTTGWFTAGLGFALGTAMLPLAIFAAVIAALGLLWVLASIASAMYSIGRAVRRIFRGGKR